MQNFIICVHVYIYIFISYSKYNETPNKKQ